jgi:hypothetical protein
MASIDEIREVQNNSSSLYGFGAHGIAAVDRARQRESFACAPLGAIGTENSGRRFWFEDDQRACVRYANANALRLFIDLEMAFPKVSFEFEEEGMEEEEEERFTVQTTSQRCGLTLRVVLAPSRDWIFDARVRGVDNFKEWQWHSYGYYEEVRIVGAIPSFVEMRETATNRIVRHPIKSYDPIETVREIFSQGGRVVEAK